MWGATRKSDSRNPVSRTTTPEKTDTHKLYITVNNSEMSEKNNRKGTRMYLEGRLRTREYEDKFKIRRRITEIHVDRVELLGRSSSAQ